MEYILKSDGKTPIRVSPLEWAMWFEHANRIVARDELEDGVRVSTVFLGLDHSFSFGPPLLWETMIFGGPHDDYTDRYSSYDEAVAGHKKALAIAKGLASDV